jgi:sugar lactone lactonase YvrE
VDIKKSELLLEQQAIGSEFIPYYKPLTDKFLYRVRTADLRDTSLSAFQLQARVETLGHFSTTDGMETDGKGNLYLGDLENGRILCINPQMAMQEILKDTRLIWPDSYSIPRGWLFVCEYLSDPKTA